MITYLLTPNALEEVAQELDLIANKIILFNDSLPSGDRYPQIHVAFEHSKLRLSLWVNDERSATLSYSLDTASLEWAASQIDAWQRAKDG